MILLQKAAAYAGSASAQFHLGVAYYHGDGVPQDYDESLRWYRLAAEQGYASAQFTLGGFYALGQIVPQDYILALMWMSLAATRAHGDSRAQILSTMSLITKKLTAKQVLEAQRLAAEWRPKSGW